MSRKVTFEVGCGPGGGAETMSRPHCSAQDKCLNGVCLTWERYHHTGQVPNHMHVVIQRRHIDIIASPNFVHMRRNERTSFIIGVYSVSSCPSLPVERLDCIVPVWCEGMGPPSCVPVSRRPHRTPCLSQSPRWAGRGTCAGPMRLRSGAVAAALAPSTPPPAPRASTQPFVAAPGLSSQCCPPGVWAGAV